MTPPRQAEEPVLTRSFGLLVTAHLLQALGFSSLMLLPLYLQHLGASRTEIGAVMASSAVSGLLSRPFVAWSLDHHGRKPTLVVGTLVTVVAMLLLYGVDRVGPLVVASRLLAGAGLGTLFSGYFTFAADLVPASRRTEGLGLFGVSGLLPLLINPFSDQIGIAPADLRWFLPAVGLVILASLIPLLALPEPRSPSAKGGPSLAEVGRALGERRLWPVWAANVTFAGLVAVFSSFAAVTAESRGIEGPARLWLTYALGAMVVRLFGGRLPDRIGPRNLVAPALGLYLGAMVLLAQAATFDAFLLAAGLAGIGHGYCFPVLTSQLVTRTDARLRGSAVSAFTAMWQAASLVAGPTFGAVADRWGDAGMYLAVLALGMVALTVWLALEHRFAPRLAPG